MHTQRRVVINMLLFLFLLSSCAKEDETTPANLLVSKTWKKGTVDKNPDSNPPGRVLYRPLLDCEKDDLLTFDSTNKLTINEGKLKCDSSEPAVKTLSYSYNASTNELIIDGFIYTVAHASKDQIKYHSHLPHHTGYDYMIYLLE